MNLKVMHLHRVKMMCVMMLPIAIRDLHAWIIPRPLMPARDTAIDSGLDLRDCKVVMIAACLEAARLTPHKDEKFHLGYCTQ
jgi:hypothetical protein